MKKIWISLLVGIFLIRPNLVMAGRDLSDDFDDNRINPANWIKFERGGPTISEINHQLEVNIPANSTDPLYFTAGYGSTCGLRGDYDIQVDFNLPIWPSGNGVRFGLFTGPTNFDDSFGVQRISLSSHDPSDLSADRGADLYLSDADSNFVLTTNSERSGKLRLKREEDKQTAYYFDSSINDWQAISSPAPFTTNDVHILLAAYSHNMGPFGNAFNDQYVKIVFDNLIVTGQKVCTDRLTPMHNPPIS